MHLHNGLFCQTVYKPVDYSFLKVDLDELLVKQVVELTGVAKSPAFNYHLPYHLERPWCVDTNSASIVKTS